MNCVETYVTEAIIGGGGSGSGGADRAVRWSTTFTYDSSLLDFQLPTTTPATFSAPPCCGTLATQRTQTCQHLDYTYEPSLSVHSIHKTTSTSTANKADHRRMVVQRQSKSMGQGEIWPRTESRPLNRLLKNCHSWLRPGVDPLCQISCKSANGEHFGK